MTDTDPTEPSVDNRYGPGLYYDEVLGGPEPDPRPHRAPTRAGLSDWETSAFPALRRHRAAAASTPVDDDLPLDPLAHLEETRSTLARFPTA